MDGVSVDSGAVSTKSPDPTKSSSNGQDAVKTHNKENGTSNGPTNNHHSSSNHSSSKHHSSSSKHHSSSSKHHSSSGEKKHHSSSSKHSSSSGDHKKHSSSSSGEKKHSSSSSGDKKHSSSSSGDKKHHSSSSSGDKKHHSSSSGDKKHHSSSSGDKKHHSSSKHKDGKEHSSSKHREHKHDKDGKHSSSDRKHEKVKTEVKVEPEEQKIVVKPEPVTPVKLPKPEPMDESEDDMPLIARAPKLESPPPKRELSDDEDDDVPLAARAQKDKKVKVEAKPKPKSKVKKRKGDDDDDDAPKKKKAKPAPAATPTKKGKKKEEPEEKWRWWEEERKDDGTKWKFLEHNGPVFAPEYELLPDNVKFYYDGKHMKLSQDTEEVATFYGRMIDHDYTTMEVFNKNFFKDWRSVMTHEEKEKIKDLKKCNFKEIDLHFKRRTEERKAMSKDEKNKIKEENARLVEEYGFCTMDNHKEKIGNFRIEPPGLFRGRGSHPKMGHLKRRVVSKDIIINCSKDSEIPSPPEGQRWKEVRHDNTVTWLASWQENVQGGTKYIMLNPASRLKGEKDWNKYETARKLHKTVDKIRATYREDWKSKEMRIRQRAVALYFIDKLALRAGNEKDEETADTVGCCSLRVEHVRLHEEMDGKEYVVEFDFLGKDSIRYYNKVAVEKRVFKNLQLFTDNKAGGDDLFDRLNTAIMNKHLQSLMDGLTAKVFRTYNASRTLQEQLDLLTEADDNVPGKMLSYNRANRAVAVLCNHQRAVPKNFSKQMENIQGKIDAKKDAIHTAKKDLKAAKSDFKNRKTDAAKTLLDRKKKAVDRLEDQLVKLEVSMTDKDENKDIALGTSKLNYLDPRISVAWCKKWEVPVEKIYNKTQRDKFAWALDMAEEDFVF